ncbi:VapC toxin family PIN domain ribonuclease [Geodermatophilus sp. TF02-6]|uniref:type II toxin-antitoxin system VapC family toxin n=1 Tax=Geodermatophilus sp. TF02-6 TaxID=2250575 RepID=UPI000DE87B0E|nr:type II toxin-antitoxin system VapC family toxin [Geodermatophilus sp. TF02-6]RBY78936.1 VapC toxin family PIN domain ribonuclease [Geodermatophilus sp. TF02-6]
MTLVVDSSAVVAALVNDGPEGDWAREAMEGQPLAAPAHLFVEVSNSLRRNVMAGHLTRDVAALAHHDLAQLRVAVFGFEPFAERVWELHPTVTAYDAAYVALAEELDVPVVTLDRRLARANGPTCTFLTPD